MHHSTSTVSSSVATSARRAAAARTAAEPRTEPVETESSESSVESPGFLASYFRDLSAVDVMTRDEELAAAVRIASLRQTFWKSILSYPPFIDGICDLAREVLPAETCPADALETMKKASRALRDRDPGETLTKTQLKATTIAAIDEVAARLGNTRAVSRSSYVHPAVLSGYEDGTLLAFVPGPPGNGLEGLDDDERWVLAYLKDRAEVSLAQAA